MRRPEWPGGRLGFQFSGIIVSPGGDIPLFGARTSRAAEPSMLLVDPRGNGVWSHSRSHPWILGEAALVLEADFGCIPPPGGHAPPPPARYFSELAVWVSLQKAGLQLRPAGSFYGDDSIVRVVQWKRGTNWRNCEALRAFCYKSFLSNLASSLDCIV